MLKRDNAALARFDGVTLVDAAQLRALRRATGLSFDVAANAAGYNPNTISMMERKVYGAKLQTVRDLLDVYGFELVLRRKAHG